MHIDEKQKMISAHSGMWSNVALAVFPLIEDDEEITTKELSERSKRIKAGHRFK